MTVWLLQPVNEETHWEPWYDKCFGMVIRAETESEARQFADQAGGDENRTAPRPWLSPEFTTCKPLLREGDAGIVLLDKRNA